MFSQPSQHFPTQNDIPMPSSITSVVQAEVESVKLLSAPDALKTTLEVNLSITVKYFSLISPFFSM